MLEKDLGVFAGCLNFKLLLDLRFSCVHLEHKAKSEESWATFTGNEKFDLLFRTTHLTLKGGSVCDEIKFSPKMGAKLPSED